ncbi:MAG: zinc ribbon domain-containing protein [Clostridia bacterium]|nr:zinc ribbon domain-containing protein [Clostridia bacterium]
MFCRKCGKDIGESNFCPDCGTKQRSDEELKASLEQKENVPQPQMVFGPDGSTRTSDGRLVFSSAKQLMMASKKHNAVARVNSLLSIFYLLLVAGAIALCVLSVISDTFSGSQFFVVLLMGFAGALSIPMSILSAFVDGKNAKWLKEDNVDVRETIRNGANEKSDRNFLPQLLVINYIKDVPKANAFSIVGNLINVIFGPLQCAFLGSLFITVATALKSHASGWLGTIVIMFVILILTLIPTLIIRKVQESKAKKHYAQSEQGQNGEQK